MARASSSHQRHPSLACLMALRSSRSLQNSSQTPCSIVTKAFQTCSNSLQRISTVHRSQPSARKVARQVMAAFRLRGSGSSKWPTILEKETSSSKRVRVVLVNQIKVEWLNFSRPISFSINQKNGRILLEFPNNTSSR